MYFAKLQNICIFYWQTQAYYQYLQNVLQTPQKYIIIILSKKKSAYIKMDEDGNIRGGHDEREKPSQRAFD